MTSQLSSCLKDLSHRERIYVEQRLQGMSKKASAAAAGYASADKHGHEIEKRTHVQQAIVAAT